MLFKSVHKLDFDENGNTILMKGDEPLKDELKNYDDGENVDVEEIDLNNDYSLSQKNIESAITKHSFIEQLYLLHLYNL